MLMVFIDITLSVLLMYADKYRKLIQNVCSPETAQCSEVVPYIVQIFLILITVLVFFNTKQGFILCASHR